MFRRLALFAAGTVLVALPSVSQAQAVCVGIGTCSITPSASLTIPRVVRLASTSSAITLLTPDFASDSLNGQAPVTSFGGLSVRANHDWTLNVSATAATWTYTPAAGASGGARVRADLEYQVGCTGAFAAMSGTASPISSGALTNSTPVSMCLRTAFPADYTDLRNRPGTYALALTLTLAAN